MDALHQPRPRSAKILAFDGVMGNAQQKKQKQAQNAAPPPPAPPPSRWDRTREAISTFWAIVLALTTVGRFVLNLYVNKLIDQKLAPINAQLQAQGRDLADALGQLKRIDTQVKTLKPNAPDLLAKDNPPVNNNGPAKGGTPGEVLAGIRAKLVLAEKRRQKLPVPELVDYKKQVQSVAPSAKDYWMTVAAIINYQSCLNQLNFHAPDPDKVAHPCILYTQEAPNATITFTTTQSAIRNKLVTALLTWTQVETPSWMLSFGIPWCTTTEARSRSCTLFSSTVASS